MQILLTFLFGVIILLFATNQLIKLTTKLAHSLRLSPLIIGVTLVAIGTSLPELVVSSLASIQNDFGLAVGNIMGSNIINILVVLGLSIFSGQIRVGTTKTQKNILVLAFVTITYVISFWLNIPGYLLAVFFICSAFVFTLIEYRWGITGRALEDKVMLKLTKKTKLNRLEYFYLLGCLISIFIGGSLVVESIEKIAAISGFSTSILGLSITSVATSLPEILAAIIGIRQKEDKLLLGSIMGSNIYNILLIGGISSFWINHYAPSFFEIFTFSTSMVMFFGIIIIFKGKIIPRLIGLLLIILSLLYLIGMYYFQ